MIGKGRLTVDLGMVNNADYYTGVIIKGYLEGYGEEVLSGGRYNKLLSDFGYDIPATVDAVANVRMKDQPAQLQPADAVIFAAPGYEMKAAKVSQELRSKGQVVEFAFFDSLDLVREYARESRIGKVVVVDEEITEVQ